MTTEIQYCYHIARNSMSEQFLSDINHIIKERPVLSLFWNWHYS